MPCWVVYQETIERRQLDRNKPATMGRMGLNSRAPREGEVRAMNRLTRIFGQKFQESARAVRAYPRQRWPTALHGHRGMRGAIDKLVAAQTLLGLSSKPAPWQAMPVNWCALSNYCACPGMRS